MNTREFNTTIITDGKEQSIEAARIELQKNKQEEAKAIEDARANNQSVSIKRTYIRAPLQFTITANTSKAEQDEMIRQIRASIDQETKSNGPRR